MTVPTTRLQEQLKNKQIAILRIRICEIILLLNHRPLLLLLNTFVMLMLISLFFYYVYISYVHAQDDAKGDHKGTIRTDDVRLEKNLRIISE